MSTYNGERYLDAQLDSILGQLPPGGRLIVRDDGSRDSTVALIKRREDPRVLLVQGHNIGFARSFLALIRDAPADAGMYMLADQDDVWKDDKIGAAWAALQPLAARPALYCCGMELVSERLEPQGKSPRWALPPSFANAMTENIVTGCTSAFNSKLRELVIRCGDTSDIYFHDWWLYLVASAFGRVIYDPNPHILYRQHGANQIGMGQGWNRYRLVLRFMRKVSWVSIMRRQLLLFRQTYAEVMSEEHQRCLQRVLRQDGTLRRAALLVAPKRYRQTWAGEVLLRLLVLADRRR